MGEELKTSNNVEKKPPKRRFKKLMKKLAKYATIPVAATCLTFTPIGKHVNPFHSKPALAEEIKKEDMVKPDIADVEKDNTVKSKTGIKLGGRVITNESGSSIAGIG